MKKIIDCDIEPESGKIHTPGINWGYQVGEYLQLIYIERSHIKRGSYIILKKPGSEKRYLVRRTLSTVIYSPTEHILARIITEPGIHHFGVLRLLEKYEMAHDYRAGVEQLIERISFLRKTKRINGLGKALKPLKKI